MSARTRGVAVSALAVALTAGCSSTVTVDDPPRLQGADARACAAFVDALPDTLAGQSRRTVEPEGAPVAAYGDPAITVTCGGSMPPGFDRFATCDEVDGVGWYLPTDQLGDPSQEAVDATLGTVDWRPVVALDVPADYRPEGLAAALSELAGPVKRSLERGRPCV